MKILKIVITCILSLLFFNIINTSASTSIVTHDLVGYWEKSGAHPMGGIGVWKNIASGYERDDVLNYATVTEKGVTFPNSATSYAELRLPASLVSSSNPFTLEYRFNTNEISSYPRILWEWGGNLNIDAQDWGTYAQFSNSLGTGTVGHWFDQPFVNDEYFDVSFVYDGATSLKMFVNEKLVENATLTQPISFATTNNIYVGQDFDGSIEYLRLYDVALSDSEVINNHLYERNNLTRASVTVSAGALDIVIDPISLDFGVTSLNTTEQTITADLNHIITRDFTGSGNGWNVTVQSNNFSNGIQTLNNGSLTLESFESIANIDGNFNPDIITGPFVIDNGSAIKIASAAVGKGMGEFQLNFPVDSLKLKIPSDTYSGVYNGTITWQIITGP